MTVHDVDILDKVKFLIQEEHKYFAITKFESTVQTGYYVKAPGRL